MTTPADFQADVIDRLARIEVHLEAIPAAHKDHEDRLRTLERGQWFLAGAAGVVSAVLTKFGLPLLFHH